MELSNDDLSVLEDIFAEVDDQLRHYEDGGMGWDSTDIALYSDLRSKHREASKRAGFWWAS